MEKIINGLSVSEASRRAGVPAQQVWHLVRAGLIFAAVDRSGHGFVSPAVIDSLRQLCREHFSGGEFLANGVTVAEFHNHNNRPEVAAQE